MSEYYTIIGSLGANGYITLDPMPGLQLVVPGDIVTTSTGAPLLVTGVNGLGQHELVDFTEPMQDLADSLEYRQ